MFKANPLPNDKKAKPGNIQKKLIKKMLKYPIRTKTSKLGQAQKDKLSQNKSLKVESEIEVEAPLVADQTPRFVTCINHDMYNGNLKEYSWDPEKIFVHQCLQDDLLMLQNVFEGKIISPMVYPLIFEHKAPQKEISVRSLWFYRKVQKDAALYANLSSDEKGYFLIGLRDLFIGACRGLLSQDEKEILMKVVDLIDPNDSNVIYKTINNIDVAPYPTASHKMVRFIDEKTDGGNPILDECFVRDELGLLIGFVDPRDLSFHNFENIINLDSLFEMGEDFPITHFHKHGNNEVYTFDMNDKNDRLLSLDKCGLYTQPVNKLSRGGERFIFSSRVLGNSITKALKNYIPDKLLMNNQFRFVNYVFRYNKFKPGDRKFTSHYDTPYHDPNRKHYSKYTLILYLTSGTADPILSIDNGKLNVNTIDNNGLIKGVIFDQKYEHEGKSFIDSDKIFLRTELVYEYKSSQIPKTNDEISRKFNIACYMTKQSVFLPELEKYSSDCFNQVAQARLDLSKAHLTKDVFICKKYKGYSFITNGYDYWFLKKVALKDAAIVAILDYFNCKYERKESFNKLTYDELVELNLNDIRQVFDYLKHHSTNKKVAHDIEDLAESLQWNIEDQQFEEEEIKSENSSKKSDKIIEEIKKEKIVASGESDNLNDDDDDDAIEEEEEKKRVEKIDKKTEDESEESEEEEEEEKKEVKKNRTKNKNDSSEEEAEDSEEDEEEDEDEYEEDGDYCHFCDAYHPATRTPDRDELEEYLAEQNADAVETLKEMKNKFTILLFNKEIKIEKSKIKVTKDSILFGNEMPGINFASCYGPYPDFEGHHSIQNINVKGYANIPPIHYKAFPNGYHLKIELFNNGFVRDLYEEIKKYSVSDSYEDNDSSF